jgi:hypothetical protein
MLRWWLVLTLVVAPATVWAQPALTTDRAEQSEASAEQRVRALTGQRAQLAARYQSELTAIDELKHEKASWRRDRDLRQSLADSADTANQLAALDRQLATARDAVVTARRTLLAAVDAELAAGASTAQVPDERGARLGRLRAQLASSTRTPRKIVIPDAEIDPAADADELDQQAKALRASEQELAAQAVGLESQAKELTEVAALRKHHERATDLMLRDDDQPNRGQPHTDVSAGTREPTGGAGLDTGHTTTPGPAPTAPADFAGAERTGFELEATIVLGDVLDHATIDGLSRASRSGDPGQRAEAVRKAAIAVRQRLQQLQQKRAAVEARAKTLH